MTSPPLLIPDWPAPASVRAAMTTRVGGVSTGAFASFNMGRGSGDGAAAVDENHRRLVRALYLPEAPRWIRQVHGASVVQMPQEGEPAADASWTGEAGVVCAVQSADCLPVLFCDDGGSVVAAAHAGWRGLAAGVLEAVVGTLPVAPERLMAWFGAAIGPTAFEVGAEVRDAFVRHDGGAALCFTPARSSGKFFADLYGLALLRLAAMGVARTFGGGRCTYREAARFFSYRRDGQCGRMAALIWLA